MTDPFGRTISRLGRPAADGCRPGRACGMPDRIAFPPRSDLLCLGVAE